jgi:hypothetical protein
MKEQATRINGIMSNKMNEKSQQTCGRVSGNLIPYEPRRYRITFSPYPGCLSGTINC